MPPRKKQDPEALAREFSKFQFSDEAIEWRDLSKMKEDFHDISRSMEYLDLVGNFQVFHDAFFKFATTKFKTKTRLKEIKHEYVRSSYFAVENITEKEKQNEVYWVDGMRGGVTKEAFNKAYQIRQLFKNIWNKIDDIKEFDATNFAAERKKFMKDVSEYFKLLAPYIKAGHKEIYEEKLVGELLQPLMNILKANKNLLYFEDNFKTDQERKVHEFKQIALEREFCKSIDEGVRLLYDVEKADEHKLRTRLDIKKVFKKLKYQGWDKNAVEFFYLFPLQQAYNKMRNNLFKLNVKGIDFYRIPLRANENFFQDIKELIDIELIAEHLLGNQLKRDQLNFAYSVMNMIKQSPAYQKLLDEEVSIVKISIPYLMVFKTFQHMRRILDAKIEEALKNGDDLEKVTDFYIGADQKLWERKQSKMALMEQAGIKVTPVVPPKKYNEEEEKEFKARLATDALKYGRFWIWEGYIDEELKAKLLDGADMLNNINMAVQQDIEDYLITEGMTPLIENLDSRNEQKEKLLESKQFLQDLKEKESKNVEENNKRPPYLWNHPDITEQKHVYRSIAAPKSCYRDQRIDQLLELNKELAQNLYSHQAKHWKEIVDRTISVFQVKPKMEPNSHFLAEYLKNE